jgi:serine/threonine-protein kinase
VTDALRTQLAASLGDAYTIERELGGGGMSRVFLAHEIRFDRRVVVKVLMPELAAGLSVERFEREIALAAQLQQANIVPVFTAGESGGLPYYMMPFAEGESLRVRMERSRVPPVEAVAALRDVARALAYAHAHGVVHRDIKPENVLLSGGTAVVTDFGIAKAVSASKTKAPGGTLTVVGTSIGTPAYMAPEQAVGDEVDARADLYAWGVIAYELLSGRHPFAGKATTQQMIAAHIAEMPALLSVPEGKVSPSLVALIMRCLSKNPSDRPSSAGEVLTTLDEIAQQPDWRPLGGSPRGSRRTVLLGTGALVLVLAVGLFMVGRSRERAPASAGANTAVNSGGARAITTIAVLPFDNQSGDQKDEYFSDGMTDELAHALARIPTVRVAGRTSSYAYKGRHAGAHEVGRALNVSGVIAGSVRRSGDRLRITAELTNASDGLVMWTGSYTSDAKDVFQVQDSVTRAIVAALVPTLRGSVAAGLAESSRGTTDPVAYDLYLQGHYLWTRRNTQNLLRAADLFREAIARDSTFARAYGGLALVQSVLSQYTELPQDSAVVLASASATRALALDSSTADAHLALGTAFFHVNRHRDAEVKYRAGLQLDPGNVAGHMWLGDALMLQGKVEEALVEHRRAVELDPLSGVAHSALSGDYHQARRFDDAVESARRAVSLNEDNSAHVISLADALVFRGHADSAITVLEAFRRRNSTTTVRLLEALGTAYAAAARWSDVDAVRTELRARGSVRALVSDAIIAFASGHREPILAMLDAGERERVAIDMGVLTCDPQFDPLRTDPKYIAASHRQGIPTCTRTSRWPFPSRAK